MKEVKTSGGRAKLTDEELIVTDNPFIRTKRLIEYNRVVAFIGMGAVGFTILGFFGQEGVSLRSISGFVLFLGGLVALSFGIALPIAFLGTRENPLNGELVRSQTQTVPVQDIRKIGFVDNGRNIAVEFIHGGTTKTLRIPFRTEMNTERERLVTALESHARLVRETTSP